MGILKKISNYSNIILIFATLIMLLYMINLFPRSMKEASDSIQLIREVQDRAFSSYGLQGYIEMDFQAILNLVDNFPYTYTGVTGREFELILDTLEWSAIKYGESNSLIEKRALSVSNRNQLRHLTEVYYEILNDRFEAFNSLFYFLSTGVLVQFIFVFISYRKNLKAILKLDRSRSDLQELQRIRENERRRIASFLHDSTIQDLGAVLLDPMISQEPGMRFRLEDIIGQLRNLTYSTSPLQLDAIGLKDSIGELIANFQNIMGTHVLYKVNGLADLELTQDARLVCFRFVQESLNNIAKHAEAHEVKVKIVSASPFLNISVSDDGVGIDFEKREEISHDKHMGLSLMEEQVLSIGGEFSIISEAGKGTTVKMKYNLEKGEDNG